MDFIKVLNKHILFEYTDLKDTEFVAWIKIMALTAMLEKEPTRDQILRHINYQTLDSLCRKFGQHYDDHGTPITLSYVLHKVLIDASSVAHKREQWKKRKQKSRVVSDNVTGDVTGMSRDREEKRREDIKEKEKEKPLSPPKKKYLDSVFLTEIEYGKLQEALGQKNLNNGIEQLDYSITVKGGKYKDHYKTLLNWFKRGFLQVNGEQAIRRRPERLPSQEEELEAFNAEWEKEHGKEVK